MAHILDACLNNLNCLPEEEYLKTDVGKGDRELRSFTTTTNNKQKNAVTNQEKKKSQEPQVKVAIS